MIVKSDPDLLTEVRKFGQFNPNACYQCGSCTVICELTDNSSSFPRKPIRCTLLGLKDLLIGGLEPWICHDCGDCSITCPRQTEPRIAMMTLRRYLNAQYDWTGLSAKMYRSKAWYLGALAFFSLLTLILIVFYHLSIVEMALPDFTSTGMGMEHMFNIITYFTLAVIGIPIFFLISHAFRMWWLTMHRGNDLKIPVSLYFKKVKFYILHSVTHKRIRECPDKSRWSTHWMLATGCVIMLVILVFFLKWFQTDNLYPIYHPQRWLGYLVTILLFTGSIDIIFGRIKKQKEIYKFSDLRNFSLPIMLFLTTLTGITVHIFRYLGLELSTHYAYAIHLIVAVPMLVVEIPFGKWSHMIYRPLALYFQSVKEEAIKQNLSAEVGLDHAA